LAGDISKPVGNSYAYADIIAQATGWIGLEMIMSGACRWTKKMEDYFFGTLCSLSDQFELIS